MEKAEPLIQALLAVPKLTKEEAIIIAVCVLGGFGLILLILSGGSGRRR